MIMPNNKGYGMKPDVEDVLADLTSIIYSFCVRLYGQRRAKRQTEKIVQELEAEQHATG